MGTPHLLTPQQLCSHWKLVQSHQKQQLQLKALGTFPTLHPNALLLQHSSKRAQINLREHSSATIRKESPRVCCLFPCLLRGSAYF